MVLILVVDVIQIGVRISGVSLNGCFVGSVPDDEYIDEVSYKTLSVSSTVSMPLSAFTSA